MCLVKNLEVYLVEPGHRRGTIVDNKSVLTKPYTPLLLLLLLNSNRLFYSKVH